MGLAEEARFVRGDGVEHPRALVRIAAALDVLEVVAEIGHAEGADATGEARHEQTALRVGQMNAGLALDQLAEALEVRILQRRFRGKCAEGPGTHDCSAAVAVAARSSSADRIFARSSTSTYSPASRATPVT